MPVGECKHTSELSWEGGVIFTAVGKSFARSLQVSCISFGLLSIRDICSKSESKTALVSPAFAKAIPGMRVNPLLVPLLLGVDGDGVCGSNKAFPATITTDFGNLFNCLLKAR